LYNVRPIWILYVVYLWCFLYVLIVFCVVLSLGCLHLFSISHVSILPWISSSWLKGKKSLSNRFNYIHV
jgi:hypothetical protein